MVEKIKKELKTPKGQFIFICGLLILTAIIWSAQAVKTSAAQPKDDMREIVFEIRDMAFGDNNPTVYLQPGETVRFTVINLEKGVEHNFAIEDSYLSTQLLAYGEKASVTFTAPKMENERDYFCMPHASMMRGKLIITNAIALNSSSNSNLEKN